jgi:hypothetical protein
MVLTRARYLVRRRSAAAAALVPTVDLRRVAETVYVVLADLIGDEAPVRAAHARTSRPSGWVRSRFVA